MKKIVSVRDEIEYTKEGDATLWVHAKYTESDNSTRISCAFQRNQVSETAFDAKCDTRYILRLKALPVLTSCDACIDKARVILTQAGQ